MPETFPPAVGQLYDPTRPGLPEGMSWKLSTGGVELLLSFSRPSQAEIDSVHGRVGDTHFALVEQPNVLLLCFRLGAGIRWSSQPWQARRQEKGTPPGLPGEDQPDGHPQASSIWWSSNGGGEDGEGGVPFDFVQIEDAEQILALRHTPYRHLFIDLPGNLHDEDTLEATLQVADDVIVPIEPEPLSWDPTATTINEVLTPIGVPYHVVINGWDPRDGLPDLEATAEFIAANGWTVCNTIVRKYKVHSRAAAHGTVVTQYGKSRIAQEGLSDFQSLALELGYGGRTQRPVPRQPRQATGAEVRG